MRISTKRLVDAWRVKHGDNSDPLLKALLKHEKDLRKTPVSEAGCRLLTSLGVRLTSTKPVVVIDGVVDNNTQSLLGTDVDMLLHILDKTIQKRGPLPDVSIPDTKVNVMDMFKFLSWLKETFWGYPLETGTTCCRYTTQLITSGFTDSAAQEKLGRHFSLDPLAASRIAELLWKVEHPDSVSSDESTEPEYDEDVVLDEPDDFC